MQIVLPETIDGLNIFFFSIAIAGLVIPYFTQKGKNQAIIEDLEKIQTAQGEISLKFSSELERVKKEHSKELEDIKNQNNLLIEQSRNHSALKIATVDRRLDAFEKTTTLLFRIHRSENIKDAILIKHELDALMQQAFMYYNKQTLKLLTQLLKKLRDSATEKDLNSSRELCVSSVRCLANSVDLPDLSLPNTDTPKSKLQEA